MHTRRSLVLAVVALVVAGGCDSSDPDLPGIATPLGYDTVRVELSGCNVPLPPVRDSSRCGAAEIGKSIDLKDRVPTSCGVERMGRVWTCGRRRSRGRLAPRSSSVRVPFGTVYHCFSKEWPRVVLTQERPAGSSVLRLEADIPNRSLIVFVQMSEDSHRLKYFAGRRNLPATFRILRFRLVNAATGTSHHPRWQTAATRTRLVRI